MDWLKGILNFLPLEQLSEILGEIVIWWSQMVKNVPPADLPMYAYLGGTVIVLLLWILVARIMPKPLGGMSWMVIFAVLLAPGTALGEQGEIAPASIGVVYALMMKDTASAVSSALPILVVLVVGLFIGFVWQLIRGAFESSLDKARRNSAEDTEANMQLASGNYLEKTHSEPVPTAQNAQNELSDNLAAQHVKAADTTTDTLTKKPVEGFYSKKTSDKAATRVDKKDQ
ncbi:hypothetical protein ACS8FD_12460 [Psychrobacter sp. 1U2]|uniref:hypothetical protein n=1 Tax=Psychrobacter sp. 1U2 TaxID=3453577 RepID=UPI003F481B0B